ncbi:MAG: phosphodiesterase [Erysipelotrichales bacterium]|nr:phosphodiesterase [Erysipelotrichales bacterium]
MKAMIISDIHGSLTCLEDVLKYYDEFGCEKLLILGDELYHGPRNSIPEGYDCKGVAARLNGMKDVIVACRGNCEAEVDQMMLEYPCMADYELVEINGRRIMLSHGHLFDEMRLPRLPFEIYLSGHTHVPVLKKENNIVFCNPGSITFPKEDTPKCFGIIDESSITVYKVEDKSVYLQMELE